MIKHGVMWIILLVVYVAVGIPLINNYLMPIVMDYINNYGNMLIVNYTTLRYVWNEANKTFTPVPQIITLDLRGLVVFIVQFMVYVGVPLIMVLKVLRR
ncbi:MAG: hypothetical protein ABIK73_07910 [candidate division WOR-3 bacterium]